VPAAIELGYHLCYGAPADEHVIDACFAPLAGLKLRRETELYLGLVQRDDMAGNAEGSAIHAAVAGGNTDRLMKASCKARPHHTLGSKRAGGFDRAY
jgi:hypothetical protein